MLKIKRDISQQNLKTVNLHLSDLNNFHSLEVVDRVSETQLQVSENFQVSENSYYIIWLFESVKVLITSSRFQHVFSKTKNICRRYEY